MSVALRELLSTSYRPQCNQFIQFLKEQKLKQSMESYRNDVCAPNLLEMKQLLDAGGYALRNPTTGKAG